MSDTPDRNSILSGPWNNVMTDLKRVGLVASSIQNPSGENGRQYLLSVVDVGLHRDYNMKNFMKTFLAHAFNVKPEDIAFKRTGPPEKKELMAYFPENKIKT